MLAELRGYPYDAVQHRMSQPGGLGGLSETLAASLGSVSYTHLGQVDERSRGAPRQEIGRREIGHRHGARGIGHPRALFWRFTQFGAHCRAPRDGALPLAPWRCYPSGHDQS